MSTTQATVQKGNGFGVVPSSKQVILEGLMQASVQYRKNPVTGEMQPYMKQYEVNDDYKVIFRRDIGDFSHGDSNHWNLEVQTVQGENLKYDLHLYLNNEGELLPFTDNEIYIPRKSPFK